MALIKGSHATLILGIIISLVLGFFVGSTNSNIGKNGISMPSLQTQNPLFTTQSATIQGKINKVEGNKITITNLDGKQGEFELSEMAVINKINSSKSNTATSSTDLSTLETDKDATLILELKGGKYTVLSVNYTPPVLPLPSLPPIPKK